MSISLRMLLTADGRQAKAEVRNVAGEVTKAGAAADGLATKATKASAATSALGRASATTATQVNVMSAAQARAAATSNRLTAANGLAAGSVANLTAQFNDIGVMLAAGQNPIQLALQQGTQITQVFGDRGAGAAVKALGAAFVSMISPLNLVTIGVIAGGAALLQWALSAGDADEKVEALTKSLETLEEQTQKNIDTLALMRTGLNSVAELRVQEELNRLMEERNQISETALDWTGRLKVGARQALEANQAEIDVLQAKLDALRAAQSELEREEATQGRIRAGYQAYATTRTQSEEQIRSQLEQQYQLYAQSRVEGAELASVHRQSLADLQNEAELRTLITSQGQNSLEVGNQRLRVERENFQAQLASSEASEAMKVQLLAAFDAAKGIAGVDVAGNIILAADAANTLARNLARAAQGQAILRASRDNPDFFDPRNESGLARETDPNRYDVPLGLPGVTLPPNPRSSRSGGRGGGGSASDARKEAEAVQNLIERYQEQLAVLRETDPVQKEMIRNRETLANASDAQRAKIEDLITQHQEETATLERKRATWDLLSSTAGGILDSLFDKSKSLGDVLKETLVNLLDVLAQGDRLGGGGGGLLGAIFPALVPGRANGGMVYGPGGPRDDKVLVAMSNGEMAINAAATARHRGLLEMINAGAPIPRLAGGGYVGPSVGASSGAPTGQILRFEATINVKGAMGNKELEEFAKRGTEIALQDFSREVLPGRVAEIEAEPRMVG